MSCFNCTQQIEVKNAEKQKAFDKAQELADKTGEWVAIWEEEGSFKFGLAEYSKGKPIRDYKTPNNLQ